MRAFAVVALLMLAACTMLTTFDPEGQPCDLSAQPGSQCLEGYHCDKGKCVKGGVAGGSGTSGGAAGSGGMSGGSAGGAAGDGGRTDGGRTDGGDGG